MEQRLFLLDGMALAYRAHFAFATRPILTSQGVNTSAMYGFMNALLDILENHEPSHIAVAFDTSAPTARHRLYPDYKAQREAMPEDLSAAIPNIVRLMDALRIPVLKRDGYEADDIIGTLAKQAELEGVHAFMVTPDKDFAQLVTESITLFRPARAGGAPEILGPTEVQEKWSIAEPKQFIDILALWGDASDNIPGAPGVGEKTAIKLVSEYGDIETLLERVDEIKGKRGEKIAAAADQIRLSKTLATIDIEVPLDTSIEDLRRREMDVAAMQGLCVEFEFNALGRRLFGEDFKAGRSGGDGKVTPGSGEEESATSGPSLQKLSDLSPVFQVIRTEEDAEAASKAIRPQSRVAFDTETTGLDPKSAELVGVSFAWADGHAAYLPIPADPQERTTRLSWIRSWMEDASIEKIGHNVKFDLAVLAAHGLEVCGPLFDTMIAHGVLQPEGRHGLDYLAEVHLQYQTIPLSDLVELKKNQPVDLRSVPIEQLSDYACEDAEVTWRLSGLLRDGLKADDLLELYWTIEEPLIRTLERMERHGIRLDTQALATIGADLDQEIERLRTAIHRHAGREFNLNSPKQLGEILFEEMRLVEKPKKTKTGQFATNEQVLLGLADRHPIVADILSYREATKLKSTYVDTLPDAISPVTGRVHTTFNQALTATGRLQSQDPNLQNIPIRSELGRQVRGAFTPRSEAYVLYSADYSQIELRIIAALSEDQAMLEDFNAGRDIHAATAAKVFGTQLDDVDADQRRRAKMVNFGIVYGISAFGLAQRLGIPRGEAKAIIDGYLATYRGIAQYMETIVEKAREQGFVTTMCGRRRYLREINSKNATQRGAAERNAINAPIQGTAADMIKLAMGAIHARFQAEGFQSRMVLQVHDELVFDLHKDEMDTVPPVVEGLMRDALSLPVRIEVDSGIGATWLEAH